MEPETEKPEAEKPDAEKPAPQGAAVEIHPPHGPIHSFRDVLLQLTIITTGIIIALSLDGLLEWNHYRMLVREARENIAREIADNKRELEGHLAVRGENAKKLDNALRFADDLLSGKKTEVSSLNVGFNLAELSDASWQSAERTGALAHMEYQEVQKYSRLYSFQELFDQQQRRAVEHVTAALAILAYGGDPNLAPPKDLELFRQHVLALRAEVMIGQQLAEQLSKSYTETLAR